MRFKEPIDEQAMRIMETDHICKDIYDLAFWLQKDPDVCLRQLKINNGKEMIRIADYHVVPIDPVRPYGIHPVKVEYVTTGEYKIFDNIYEASAKLQIDISLLRKTKNGSGAWGSTIKLSYL